jgi:hypothetical protein
MISRSMLVGVAKICVMLRSASVVGIDDDVLLEDGRNAGGVSKEASFYFSLDAELLTSTADMHLSNHYMYQHCRY